LNIIGNAFDALEDRPGPRVKVGTLLEQGGAWVRVVVVDNGVGIPADKVEDIFRPFISTKGSRGTGLGLAVSRKIFREHGGDILVQSQAGKGSRFIMRLPRRSPLSPDGVSSAEWPVIPPREEPD
jgi:signal transduction histidine kinase